MDMTSYLIENMMGFENPIEEGRVEELEIKKLEYEQKPRLRKVYYASNEVTVSAKYYVVSKDEWDFVNCPIMPVDLS
jgi:hypothetical protein